MTNFAEKYPACADCPSLKALQSKHDAKLEFMQAIELKESFERIIKTDSIEKTRVAFDEEHAQYLDEAEAVGAPDPLIIEANELYGDIDTALVSQTPVEITQDEYAQRLAFLTSIDSEDAAELAYACNGPLNISILAFHRTICRSRLLDSFGLYHTPPTR